MWECKLFMELQTEQDKILIQQEFEDMEAVCRPRCQTEKEWQDVVRAFNLANDAHMGIRRKSGDPYILHPIAVAKIVVQEIGLAYRSIVASLLHDVVEDTDYTVADVRRMFGDKIASLVDGLTKIESAINSSATSSQAENFKRILLTLNDDARVVLIKLADRLHNMRTIKYMPEHKRTKMIAETMYVFVPLAHRLGLYSIKSELEDISLKYSHPHDYELIRNKISESENTRRDFIQRFTEPIITNLDKVGIKYEISGRPKSIYSVYHKMTTKNVAFEEIYDLFAVRIVFNATESISERMQCYQIFSIITDLYRENPMRRRDWTSTPKANGYEALHCTVMGPRGKWVEVQIRSQRMEDIAERGLAAHWKYKDISGQESDLDKWLQQVRDILENPDISALEFLDRFHAGLLTTEIYVFTPKGDTKSLPKGATVLDFAYSIHSAIGNKAIAAKVNHTLVSLNHVLRSGDQVEILTAETQTPKREWLDMVTTPKARSFVTDALKSEVKDQYKIGREMIEERLAKMGIQPQARVFNKLIRAYDVNNKHELFSKVGAGLIDLKDFDSQIRKNFDNKWVHYWGLQFSRIIGSGNKTTQNETLPTTNTVHIDKKQPFLLEEETAEGDLSYKIAPCCKPIPGDDIIGFIDDDEFVTIHKGTCPLATRYAAQYGDRIINSRWTKHTIKSFLTRIEMRGIDRVGILNELTNIITDELAVNIRKLFIESHDGIFEGYIDLYVHDTSDLDNLIAKVKKMKEMEIFRRVEKIEE